MIKTRLYFDWNATAPLLPVAREAMIATLEMTGNPSSVHREGRTIRSEIERARAAIAAIVGTTPSHVTFTSGATEAANHVLTPHFKMGKADLFVSRLIVSAIEHKAIRQGGRFAPENIDQLPVKPSGLVDLDALETMLSAHDRTSGLVMVAVMLANNETGIIQPVAEASALVHAHGGIMVVDGVQAVGRMKVDINALDADFLIISSHKIGGPKGAGALISRGETMMPRPLMVGGGHERGHRSGTENAAAIVGFGAAAREMIETIESRTKAIGLMRDRLEAGMMNGAPDVVIHGKNVDRLVNTCFFSLPGLKAETGQIAFDMEGVALSAGSACSSGKVGESHVLAAMGLDERHGALRLSIGAEISEADIDEAIEIFGRIAARRKMVDAA